MSGRAHTMVVTINQNSITGVMLEKDWFSYEWCELFEHHQRVERPQGMFHVVNQTRGLSPLEMALYIDAAIAGKIRVFDLRQYSRFHQAAKKAAK